MVCDLFRISVLHLFTRLWSPVCKWTKPGSGQEEEGQWNL